jgi:hypothetical protein
MRIAERGMAAPVRRNATAAAEGAGKDAGPFSAATDGQRDPLLRRLLKKVQMQGGARRAE